jgi:hypothetical protein
VSTASCIDCWTPNGAGGPERGRSQIWPMWIAGSGESLVDSCVLQSGLPAVVTREVSGPRAVIGRCCICRCPRRQVRTSSKIAGGEGEGRITRLPGGVSSLQGMVGLARRSIRWNATAAAQNKSTRRERRGQMPREYARESIRRMEERKDFGREGADRGLRGR